MFELERLKVTLSFDFMVMAQWLATNYCDTLGAPLKAVGELAPKLSEFWGVPVNEDDIKNAILIVSRLAFKLPQDLPESTAKFLRALGHLPSTVPMELPPAYLSIVAAYAERERAVLELHQQLPELFRPFSADTRELMESPEFLNDIDGRVSLDPKVQKLIEVLKAFSVVSPVDPTDWFCHKDHVIFPNNQLLSWYAHCDDPTYLGVVTTQGMLWVNKMPIHLRSWKDIVDEAKQKAEERAKQIGRGASIPSFVL